MRARKSKTMWFSFLLVLLGALMELFPYLREQIDPKYYSFIFVGIGLIVAVLRFLTTQPLDNR